MNPDTGEVVELKPLAPMPAGMVDISEKVARIVDAGHRALSERRRRLRKKTRAAQRRNRR